MAQVTRQFGEMDPECAAKQKFAAWRAAEVRSALKEGRAPTPLPQKMDELPLDDRYNLAAELNCKRPLGLGPGLGVLWVSMLRSRVADCGSNGFNPSRRACAGRGVQTAASFFFCRELSRASNRATLHDRFCCLGDRERPHHFGCERVSGVCIPSSSFDSLSSSVVQRAPSAHKHTGGLHAHVPLPLRSTLRTAGGWGEGGAVPRAHTRLTRGVVSGGGGGGGGVHSALEAELAMLERDLHSQVGSSAAQPDTTPMPPPPAAPAFVAPPVRSPLSQHPRGVPKNQGNCLAERNAQDATHDQRGRRDGRQRGHAACRRS